MHDMLPRKPTTGVADLKKNFMKDSLFANGMNPSSASPALMSPAHSGGSSSPAQDEGINMKMRPDSPTHMINDKMMNSATSMMPKPLTSSMVPATTTPPLSSPGHGPLMRATSKSSPKQRRNPNSESRHRNPIFENSLENNFCANNNNITKLDGKFSLQRRVAHKTDEQINRTPSRNSISDDLSTSSLTPTTDEQANPTSNQNLEFGSIFDDEIISKVLSNIKDGEHNQGNLFPDTNAELKEFDAVITSLSKSNADLIFDPSRNSPLDLDGTILGNMKDSQSPMATKPLPTVSGNSINSPSFDSKVGQSRGQSRIMQKSHLQDILGVTDTQRLENMSRPIDSVSYKSPTTTTSYSTGVKPTINQPCTMAPPSRHTNITSPSYKPRPQFQFEGQMFRPNAHGFMDNAMSHGNWSRGSPRGIPPSMKSPSMIPSYVENTISPSGNVNPMSGLQNTVDSIPAAPSGSEPGTPTQFMGPPHSTTPSPGGGRMRPPPSPSVTGDKRCTSADSVAAGNCGKRAANKRERTKSADSKDEERKDPTAPKNKRRKSKSKDDNNAKKSNELKTLGRGPLKDDKLPRQDSALTSLLDAQSRKNNPYEYIFSTDAANNASEMVAKDKDVSIILYHQSYVGNCRILPSEHFKPSIIPPKTEIPDTQTMSMPTTSRSPTDMSVEKSEPNNLPLKSPSVEHNPSIQVKAINLQDTKPAVLPLPETHSVPKSMKQDNNLPMPPVTSHNGDQDEMSAEKMRDRKYKLVKLKKLNEILFQGDAPSNPPMRQMQGPPSWQGHPGPMRYPLPVDKLQPGMKDMPDGMMPRGQPGMGPENAEWLHLVQEHHAVKMRKQEVGMPGELASRPPPPYAPSQRYIVPEGYIPDARMPMDHMNHPRMQRMGPGHRLIRLPQESRGPPAGYMHPRMGIPRHYAPNHPNQPQGHQQRMPMYDPYAGPSPMRHPSRLPHPGMRPPGENYPFSEQLMKQASYYNSVPPYDPESGNPGEWSGPDGSQRLSHMPGSSSPAVGPQGQVMVPMDMNSRMAPGAPNRQGYESMGHYPGDMQPQRFEMLPPMGSPTGTMDGRVRGPSGVGSMMNAMARRGGQRPPDLNLGNQIPPRSPMNYPGHMPSPSMAAMSHPVGPRFSNPGEMGHPPQPSPMHSRSPSVAMGQHMNMGPSSAGVEQQQMMMGPQSAGPMSNPPPNDWPGSGPMPGTPTANSNMMHHSMTSQHAGMTSQQGMMPSQASMMSQHQPAGMMVPPGMMSQPAMMVSQSQVLQRVPSNPSSGKPGPNPLSLMMDRMNTFKMPDKSPLYQDAVKDTASPPPLTHHSEPPPLSHNPMPTGMRMSGPSHPPTYDTRVPHPRMGPHFDGYPHPQGYPPGHPSPMPAASMPGAPMMMSLPHESLPPPSDYPQGQRGGFTEVTDFDLRNIIPSDRPSQTISYMPPDNNPNQFSSPEWVGPDNIRSHLMQGPPHPAGPRLGMP